ncbi:MAG: alpha/beta fold hydrolase [Anaerolineae bacterium]
MQKEMLQLGGNSIAVYQSEGTGPAALLVHGNSSSARSFQHQLQGPIGAQFRLVAIDLPGHGESAPATDPQATYSPGGYASVVVGVAEQLGLTGAVFVGWSLGGHILLEAAGRLPNAAGLMIFGTPPIGIPPAMEQAFLPNPAMGAAFNPDLSEEEMAAFVGAFLKPGAEAADFFYEDIRRTDGQARALLGASLNAGSYKDEIEVVANLSTPLAILHGEHEQLINGDYFDSLTMPTLWRGAVQVIPEAGHAPHWEQPDRFNALLVDFLGDTQG